MTFLADLHIHSRFSLATSKDLTPQNLDAWARAKGLGVIGTGDFTHPKWREELHSNLQIDPQSGLYTLKGAQETLPFVNEAGAIAAQKPPLFCLQTEISSIYKKNGRTRKVHNLIYVPTLEDADRFAERLGKFGNINSYGRPILGLDSRDLLELLLDTVPDGVLVPAHIWTPWFSLFGSRSGFDSIYDCFEDLTDQIFALETGLSSDPPMNRYISSLDKYALISNSDAHSGSKLGREANLFSGEASYQNIFNAIKASAQRQTNQDELPTKFLGTLEFFPEEGKYHLDGHRACNISLNPLKAQEYNNICPVCGKPLTIGVLHRVMELADRRDLVPLDHEPNYKSIMPLQEICAEILGLGPTSQKVLASYGQTISKLGPELDVLVNLPLEDINHFWPELGEGIRRLRTSQVLLKGGYDGEFGQVHLFDEKELPQKKRVRSTATQKKAQADLKAPHDNLNDLDLFQKEAKPKNHPESSIPTYSLEQTTALKYTDGPSIVIAGPGSGKTHLLMGRLKYLLESNLDPTKIVALTFTKKAAKEMRDRLERLNFAPAKQPFIDTIHAFCWQAILAKVGQATLLSEEESQLLWAKANNVSLNVAKRSFAQTNQLREQLLLNDPNYKSYLEEFTCYQNLLRESFDCPCFDFTGLLEEGLKLFLGHKPDYAAILVDEIQDCSLLNLKVIQSLLPEDGQGFFGIGDPNQAIYGFRGAVKNVQEVLQSFYPNLTTFKLKMSYRSSQKILDCAQQLIPPSDNLLLEAFANQNASLNFCLAPNEISEARWIAKNISQLLGGSSLTLTKEPSDETLNFSPNDIAILVRYKILIPTIAQALKDFGIPCLAPSMEQFYLDEVVDKFLSYIDPKVPTTDPLFPYDPLHLPPLETLKGWLDSQPWASNMASQSQAFMALENFYGQCSSWENFFERLVWLEEEDSLKAKTESVQILTLHAAKGLEFRACFLPALEDGILPAKPNIVLNSKAVYDTDKEDLTVDDERIAEEKRLFYVGLTRASQFIYLSAASQRKIYGQKLQLPISPFYQSIENMFQQAKIRELTKKVQTQNSLF
ncbi:MAG: UvrD-helicase domain-containing protein [Desulfovibrionaceae bacterium]|nr:UvrD-helicase domain-containing protein [Desulfovibrionaceae bacterium]